MRSSFSPTNVMSSRCILEKSALCVSSTDSESIRALERSCRPLLTKFFSTSSFSSDWSGRLSKDSPLKNCLTLHDCMCFHRWSMRKKFLQNSQGTYSVGLCWCLSGEALLATTKWPFPSLSTWTLCLKFPSLINISILTHLSSDCFSRNLIAYTSGTSEWTFMMCLRILPFPFPQNVQ